MLGNDLYRKRSHLSDCDQCLIVKLSQDKVSAIAFKQFLEKVQQEAVKSYCLSYCEMNMPTVNICVKHVNWIPFPLDMPTKDSDSLVNYNHMILVIVPTRFVGYKFALIKFGKVV